MLEALHQVKKLPLFLIALSLASFVLAWRVTPLAEYATPDYIVPQLKAIRELPGSLLMAIGVYIIATFIFLPRVFMMAAIVVVYPPLSAFTICITGSLVSAALGYLIGILLSPRVLQNLLGDVARRISGYLHQGGVVGVTLLRFVPAAPFTAVNVALAMLEVPFFVFITATFLALLPGTITACLLGFSILEAWQHPNLGNIGMVAAGFMLWLAIVVSSHMANLWWKKHRNKQVCAA